MKTSNKGRNQVLIIEEDLKKNQGWKKKAGWAEQTRRTAQDVTRRRLIEIYRNIQRRNQEESEES